MELATGEVGKERRGGGTSMEEGGRMEGGRTRQEEREMSMEGSVGEIGGCRDVEKAEAEGPRKGKAGGMGHRKRNRKGVEERRKR